MVSRTRGIELLTELILEMAEERKRAWGYKGEIAAELGIPESTVGRLERGTRGVSAETIEDVAKQSARFRIKLRGAEPTPVAAAPEAAVVAPVIEQASETRDPQRDAADPRHWLKHQLDASDLRGQRRDAVISELKTAAATAPLQPSMVGTLVKLWLRLEKAEAAAANPNATSAIGKHSEARGGRRLAAAKPAKRLK